ncbi:hypothetical protein [Holdemanella biformis]|uniref:Uncharacterized protein n=1 Tax=Holdemanella biformis TaxID=1735 RepID=A0A413UD02_9FIRM|nr:hypothetical protein [Holdemanella biformis]RHB07164.1 hypothetical protein DW907_05210 [Holdemanella biformis]
MPVMEENKFETAKVALEKKFEFDSIVKKIEELGWDKDNNIIITYYQNIIGSLDTTEKVCGFMDWFDKEKNGVDVTNFNVSTVSSLLKKYRIWVVDSGRTENVETMIDEQDTSNDLYNDTSDEHETNACCVDNSQVIESLDNLTRVVYDTHKTVNDINENDVTLKTYEAIGSMEKLLRNQMKQKTMKKASFEQVEGLSKDVKGLINKSESMQTVVERIDGALPKTVEKMYTSIDITKSFLVGIGACIGVFFIVGLGIRIIKLLF